jgi:hypothetical protein
VANQAGQVSVSLRARVPEVVSLVYDDKIGAGILGMADSRPSQGFHREEGYTTGQGFLDPEVEVLFRPGLPLTRGRLIRERSQVGEFILPLVPKRGWDDHQSVTAAFHFSLQQAQADKCLSEPDGIGDDDTSIATQDVAGAFVRAFLMRCQGRRAFLMRCQGRRGE